MIRTLIIEDEPKARESLEILLNRYCPDIELCGAASGFDEGYRMISEQKPDLIFTDIQLNSVEGNGIELVQTLIHEKVPVIFISAWKEHAADAFRVNAIDYLLKPVNVQQLIQAVEKAKEYIGKNPAAAASVPEEETLHVPTSHGFIIVRLDDIIRCEAEGPYTHFYVEGKKNKLTSSVNLGQMEQKLKKNMFFRLHKSHIVNRRHIIEYQRGEGGIAKMTDESQVPVSRNLKDDFLRWLGS